MNLADLKYPVNLPGLATLNRKKNYIVFRFWLKEGAKLSNDAVHFIKINETWEWCHQEAKVYLIKGKPEVDLFVGKIETQIDSHCINVNDKFDINEKKSDFTIYFHNQFFPGRVFSFQNGENSDTCIPNLALDERCEWLHYPRKGLLLWFKDFIFYFKENLSVKVNQCYIDNFLTDDDTAYGDYDDWVTEYAKPTSLGFLDLLIQYKLIEMDMNPILKRNSFLKHADETILKEKFSYARYLTSVFLSMAILGSGIYIVESVNNIYALIGSSTSIAFSSVILLLLLSGGYLFPHLMKTREITYANPSNTLEEGKTIKSYSPQTDWQPVVKLNR